MPNSFGNPFAIPQVQTSHLQTRLPDPMQSIAALIRMQMAQARAAARATAKPQNREGDLRYGKYVTVPQKDGTKKQVWVWGNSQKERDAAGNQAIEEAVRSIINDDKELQKDLAEFEGASVPGRKEILERVRQNHAPRLSKIIGVPGEAAMQQMTAGLDRAVKERDKAVNAGNWGTQLSDAAGRIYRTGKDAILSIFDSSAEKVARGNAANEAEAKAIKDNAYRDELARLEREGRSTLGFQLSNPVKAAINFGAPMVAIAVPTVIGGAVAGVPGAAAAGAAASAALGAGESLGEVAGSDMPQAQKEATIGQTEGLSALVGGATGALLAGPLTVARPAARAAVSRVIPSAVPYRMLPGATAQEARTVGQRWAAEQAVRRPTGLLTEMAIQGGDAAAINALDQLGRNAAYNYGTGQDRSLYEGLGEAVAGGLVAGVPFGAWARFGAGRQRQAAQTLLDNTQVTPPGAVEIARSRYTAPTDYAYPIKAVAAPTNEVGLTATPPVITDAQRARVTQDLRNYADAINNYVAQQRRVQDYNVTRAQQASVINQDASEFRANLERALLRKEQQQSLYTGNTAAPAARQNQNIGRQLTPTEYAAREQSLYTGNTAAPEARQSASITSSRTLEERGGTPLFANQQALDQARDYLRSRPSSKAIKAYMDKALNDGVLNISETQTLQREYYNPNKKAQSYIYKALDDVNRRAAQTSGASEPVARMEPNGQGRTHGINGENITPDSTVPRDTEATATAVANSVTPEVATGSAAIEGRGYDGSSAQNTGQVETPPAASVEQGIGGAERSNGESGVGAAAPVITTGSEGQRGLESSAQQRPGNDSNAEQINAGVIEQPTTNVPPEEARAIERENMVEATSTLPDTLIGKRPEEIKVIEKDVKDSIRQAMRDSSVPPYIIKDVLKQDYEQIKNTLHTAGIKLPDNTVKLLDELITPVKEKRYAARELERRQNMEGMEATPPVKESAPEPPTVKLRPTNKPLTEKTYATTRKNLEPLLIRKLKSLGVSEESAKIDIEAEAWDSIRDQLKAARQLDAVLENKLTRMDEYKTRQFNEELDARIAIDNEAVAELEKVTKAVVNDPSPENIQKANEAANKVEAATAQLSQPERERVEEAQTILEEHGKSENESVSEAYLKQKDDLIDTTPERPYTNYTDNISVLSADLGMEWNKIYPNKKVTPSAIAKLTDTFIKAGLYKKLTKAERIAYDKALEAGIQPLKIDVDEINERLMVAHNQGFSEMTDVDIVKMQPSESTNRIITNGYRCI